MTSAADLSYEVSQLFSTLTIHKEINEKWLAAKNSLHEKITLHDSKFYQDYEYIYEMVRDMESIWYSTDKWNKYIQEKESVEPEYCDKHRKGRGPCLDSDSDTDDGFFGEEITEAQNKMIQDEFIELLEFQRRILNIPIDGWIKIIMDLTDDNTEENSFKISFRENYPNLAIEKQS